MKIPILSSHTDSSAPEGPVHALLAVRPKGRTSKYPGIAEPFELHPWLDCEIH